MITATLCPAWCRSIGSAPQTSASPPVLANGATSLVAKTIFKVRPPNDPLFAATCGSLRGYSVWVGVGPANVQGNVMAASHEPGNLSRPPLKSLQQAQHGFPFKAAS